MSSSSERDPNTSTAKILDAYLAEAEALDDSHAPDGKLHPSSMWLCNRQAVMVARGDPVTNPPSPKNLRVFEIGKIIHRLMQSALTKRYGDNFTPEFTAEGIALVAGHGDGLLRKPAYDLWQERFIVYEFKSTRSLSKVVKEGKAQEHHLMQAATYVVALRRQKVNVTELRIVYFEKTNMDIVEFVHDYDPAWEQKVDDKVNDLSDYLDPNAVQYAMNPPCTGPKWLHSYCPFFPACENGSNLRTSVAVAGLGGVTIVGPTAKGEDFSW